MRKSFWLGLALAAAFTAVTARADSGWDFIGRAADSEGRLLYIEKHRVDYGSDGISKSRTEYFDTQGGKIGELISDYRYGPRFGSYTFRDLRAGYKDGAEVLEERIRMFRRPSPDATTETATIPRTQRQMVGQGFHYFIADNLAAIAADQVLHVELVLPSRLDQFDFRIRKRALEGTRLVVRLEIDNWFLRFFAPYVEADYDLKSRKLLQYRGISNLADPKGDHPVVTIDYEYPGH